MFFSVLPLDVFTEMTSGISSLTSVFTSLFSSAMTLVTGNWILLAGVGIPIIGGVLFAVISWLKNR